MADITKCNDNKCKWRKTCYRYWAPVGDRQSWMPSPRVGDNCQMYWKIKNPYTNDSKSENKLKKVIDKLKNL